MSRLIPLFGTLALLLVATAGDVFGGDHASVRFGATVQTAGWGHAPMVQEVRYPGYGHHHHGHCGPAYVYPPVPVYRPPVVMPVPAPVIVRPPVPYYYGPQNSFYYRSPGFSFGIGF
jgi:hypothetical protein